MKLVICTIIALYGSPDRGYLYTTDEKAFSTLEECMAWKHQQEFQPAIAPIILNQYFCLPIPVAVGDP